jgi:hypothetical protein
MKPENTKQIPDSPSFVPRLTCEFVEVSSLVPKDWETWFWTTISDNAPFSWGDLNRALVTASDFRSHCMDCVPYEADQEGVSPNSIDNFMLLLEGLGETYIDLEN